MSPSTIERIVAGDLGRARPEAGGPLAVDLDLEFGLGRPVVAVDVDQAADVLQGELDLVARRRSAGEVRALQVDLDRELLHGGEGRSAHGAGFLEGDRRARDVGQLRPELVLVAPGFLGRHQSA